MSCDYEKNEVKINSEKYLNSLTKFPFSKNQI
jgi:hypothetical protein